MKIRMIAMSILVAGSSLAIANAGFKCDETAKKASKKSASACCASATKVKTVSASADADCDGHKTVAKKECSAAEQAECATKVSAKKVKSSSCCASKKSVKMSDNETTTTEASAVATPNNK
jgi:hypothetical protein